MLLVGVIVTIIVVTAGMVSTTYVQFIKGSLLVFFCDSDGSHSPPRTERHRGAPRRVHGGAPPGTAGHARAASHKTHDAAAEIFAQADSEGSVHIWREVAGTFEVIRSITVAADGSKHYAGFTKSEDPKTFSPTSRLAELPGKVSETGPVGPIAYLTSVQNGVVQFWSSEKFATPAGAVTAFVPRLVAGSKLLVPGGSPTFKGVPAPSSPTSSTSFR